jgi:hypothetical protein
LEEMISGTLNLSLSYPDTKISSCKFLHP